MTRRERLVRVLSDWDALHELTAAGGVGEAGSAVPMLAHAKNCRIFTALVCNCYRAGLDELGSVLHALAVLEPRYYLHLNGRYRLQVRARRQNVRVKGGVWQGLQPNTAVLIPDFAPARPPDKLYEDVLIARWPEWVEGGLVESALDWLESQLPPEVPQLPREALQFVA